MTKEPTLFDDPDEPLAACPTCGRPYATDRGYHAARNTDPSASHEAVTNRRISWDSKRGIALRVYAAHPEGLTHHEARRLAERHLGPGALGSCWWKRISELATEYEPPLIALCYDSSGAEIKRPGEFGDPVGVYRITADGVARHRAINPNGAPHV